MQDAQSILPVGEVVQGRYKIEKLLGKGGFGAVYLVRDLRVQGNLFALKEVIDPSERERKNFAMECRLLQRLDHPALPRFYRVFESEINARSYLLMDYVAGENLDIVRQQRPGKRFSLPEALRVMTPILDAVAYLHQCQPPVIHRDIKPSNIIMPASGENTVLVDFGIAKEYNQEATTTAIRRLSPNYSAPEHYTSGTNPGTDIYGLAATLYALLSGVSPVDSLQRLIQMRTKGLDPLEPLTQYNPEIPPAFSEAVARAMEMRTEDRFDSVQEFWQVLQQAAPAALQQVPAIPLVTLTRQSIARPTTPPALPVEAALPATPPPVPAESDLAALTTQRINSSYAETEKAPSHAVPPHMTHTTAHRRRLWLPVLAAMVLLLSIFALAFATNLLPLPQSLRGGAAPTSVAHSQSPRHTLVPHATVSVATPGASPKALSTPAVTPHAPVAVPPLLHTSYSGSLHNQPAAQNGTMTLTNVQQTGTVIKGTWTLSNGFTGQNTFVGAITADKHLHFVVVHDPRFLPLLFQGQVNTDGTLSGSYCSERNNQCDYTGGGYGTWTVSPTSTTTQAGS